MENSIYTVKFVSVYAISFSLKIKDIETKKADFKNAKES